MVDKTTKLGGLGRRQFTKTLAGMGLSTTLIKNISQEKLKDLTGNPTQEVPRVKAYKPPESAEEIESIDDLELEYYTIDRDKWIRVETAIDAANRVQKRINNIDTTGLISTAVSTGTKTEKKGKKLIVKINKVINDDENIDITNHSDKNNRKRNNFIYEPAVDKKQLSDYIGGSATGYIGDKDSPEATVEGIPIEVEERIHSIQHQCDAWNTDSDYYQYNYPDCPGGAACNVRGSGWDGYTSGGTTCVRVYNYNKGKYLMLTAGHVAFEVEEPDDPGEPDHAGEGRGVGQHSQFMGNVETVDSCYAKNKDWSDNYPIDMATFNSDNLSGRDHTSRIANDNGSYDEDIVGAAHSNFIADLEDDNEVITKQGKVTGRCDGIIYEYDQNNPRGSTVTIWPRTENGDSGCPYIYTDDSGDTYSIALHIHGTKNGSNEMAVGTATYSIINEFNLSIF